MKDFDIPEGYKSTDVGIIPEDWKLRRLSEVTNIDIDNLGSHTKPDYIFKYISLEDVERGILKSQSEYVFASAPSRARRKVKRNDILVATVRPNLQSHLFIQNEVKDLVCSTGFSVIRCDPDITDSKFIYHHFFANFIETQFHTLLVGSNYPAVNSSDIKNLQLPFPPLPEQKEIARVLSDVDELIRECDTLLAKKRDIKQGTMQQLLTGKQRLPGFSGEWEEKKLEEITNITRLAGAEYSSVWKEEENGEIIALRGFNIGNNQIISKDIVRISNELSLKLNRSRIYKGDIVYPCVGTIGNAVVIEENDKYHIQQNIAKITPLTSIISPYYLVYFLMSPLGHNEVLRFNATSSQPNVLVGSLRKYRIPFPTLPEQKAISEILSDMDTEIETLEKKRDKYKAIKQGMMQELLTGRIRLVN